MEVQYAAILIFVGHTHLIMFMAYKQQRLILPIYADVIIAIYCNINNIVTVLQFLYNIKF